MNLAGLFQYGNKSTANPSAEKINVKGNNSATNTSQAQQAVKNLAPGQTIQGEIIEKNGNEVQIRVDKDVVITAKLDRDIPVSVGQNMTFEVKNNSGSQIALRPLYENMAQDANVLKALEAAKLPATKELMQMVSAMMKQGMSIDKNALLDMSKLMMSNAGARPETVVTLKALNLPVTPENIQQFENYERYEHQILKQVSDVLLEIPKTFQSMVSSGQGNVAIDFYTQLLDLVTGAGAGTQASEGTMQPDITAGTGNMVFSDIVEDNSAAGMAGNADQNIDTVPNLQSKDVATTVQSQVQTGMTEELLQLTQDGKGIEEAGTNGTQNTPATQMANAAVNETLLGIVNTEGREQLASLLGKLGASESILAQVKEGSISPEQLMKSIQQLLSQKADVNRTDLMQLFGSKEYNQVLENAIRQQWLLKPENVANKKDVEEFYGRLRTQTSQMLESLGQIAKDTPLANQLSNMQNNLDFMNQMNQAFQYIQLPLKMSGGEAHGDLYVYANRRNKPSEDGSVSALLHLDMEHLGTMDIHVRMKDKNVSTKFYLQDESVIDFIAEHIHILNERLQKKGYNMQAEMIVSEDMQEKTNVVETIMAQEKKSTLLAQYSFDVRA